MGCRRRHSHRRPFLKVTEAETTADLGAVVGRLRKLRHEVEVLGLADAREHVEAALACTLAHVARGAPVAGQGSKARSIGQHEPEAAS